MATAKPSFFTRSVTWGGAKVGNDVLRNIPPVVFNEYCRNCNPKRHRKKRPLVLPLFRWIATLHINLDVLSALMFMTCFVTCGISPPSEGSSVRWVLQSVGTSGTFPVISAGMFSKDFWTMFPAPLVGAYVCVCVYVCARVYSTEPFLR